VVRSADDAATAVARIAEAGFDCVKVYDGLSPEALEAVRVAARRRGLPVIGHVPRATRFETAQLDDVQHLTGIAGYPDGPPWPHNAALWAEVDAARRAELVEAARKHGMAVTPTLVALDRMSRLDDIAALRAEPDAALLPRFYRDVVWSPLEGVGAEVHAAMRAALPAEAQLVAALHEAGVPVHLGSDTLVAFIVPGAGLHREMRLFRDAVGLEPETIWALATRGNADALDVPELGRLVAGAPADLLVFREDPTADLGALSTLEAVVADGRLYRRRDLDAQIGRVRAFQDGAVVDWVSTTLVRRMLDRVRSDAADADERPADAGGGDGV
jgi:cytosine/adenosine deaminase-related metal-dependent hydrolase